LTAPFSLIHNPLTAIVSAAAGCVKHGVGRRRDGIIGLYREKRMVNQPRKKQTALTRLTG